MDPYNLYKIYQGMNLHFTTTYDVFMYGFTSKSINIETYNDSKAKPKLIALSSYIRNEKEAGQFCLANFVYNDSSWLYNDHREANDVYTEWTKTNSKLIEIVKQDSHRIQSFIDDGKFSNFAAALVKTPKGNRPPLFQLVLSKEITREVTCILDKQYGFLEKWRLMYEFDPMIDDYLFKLRKYGPFLDNSSRLIQIFMEIVRND